MSQNYWRIATDEILGNMDSYNALTEAEQAEIAKSFQSAAEMESEACGYLNIPNPMEDEVKRITVSKDKEASELNRQLKDCLNFIAFNAGLPDGAVYISNGRIQTRTR